MIGVGPGGPLGRAHCDVVGNLPAQPGVCPAALDTAVIDGMAGLRQRATAAAADRAAERLSWAVLIGTCGIGPQTLQVLLRVFGSGRAALETAGRVDGAAAVRRRLQDASGRVDPGLAPAIAAAADGAARFAATLGALDVAIVTTEEPWYPERLRSVQMPPPVLFVRGPLDVLCGERAVAVVGTRRPTERGRRFATAAATALAQNGAVVVAGLALGVDGAAHAATVLAGGRTVAVLGSGHGHLYPAAHEALAARIVDGGGAVISELAPETPAVAGTFPRRNRVIAGLTDATVVVEAGERSGALITAAWAMEQGRACFVVPGPVDVEQSVGCNRLLRLYPEQARAVPGIPELLEDLGWDAPGAGAGVATAADGAPRPPARTLARTGQVAGPGLPALLAALGSAEAAVARIVAGRPATVDELVAGTGHAPAAVLAVLTRLEDRGLVVPALGRYAAAGALAATPPEPRPG